MKLKLSDSMALGRTLTVPGSYMSYESCAIGVGMAAFGIEENSITRHNEAVKRFPWLNQEAPQSFKPDCRICIGNCISLGVPIQWKRVISHWYHEVSEARMTFDQLIDKVRAIEPEETETHTMPAPLIQTLQLTEQEAK